MIYADYDFYKNEFHGRMREEDFLCYGEKSSAYINAVTFGRITPELLESEIEGELIRRACCACAEVMGEQDRQGNITHETVGSHSKTYGEISQSAREKSKYAAVKMYLGNVYSGKTKIMYRGV